MRKLNTCGLLLLLLPACYGISCKKADAFAGENAVPPPPQIKLQANDAGKLSIKKIRIKRTVQYGFYFPGQTRIGTIEYNKWGDPVRIQYNFNSSSDRETNWLFKYNHRHQLTDAIQHYNTAYLAWYKYVYNHNGTVIRDTTSIFGLLQEETPSPGRIMWVTYYSYDEQNRVSKTLSQTGASILVTEYHYDGRGNLIKNGAVYDDMVNLHRTSAIFMFVARDYSVNNAINAERYNDRGLPLSFRHESDRVSFLKADMGHSDIEYENY